MAPMQVLRQAIDSATVRTVFGEPITADGVTVLPVAKVRVSGGGGGGTGPMPAGAGGDAPSGDAGGSGSGFLRSCRPARVYTIRDGHVAWRPAVDVNKIIVGGQIIAVVALLTVRAFIRTRSAGK
jgi:uncharacterized spore protein YtfJ